MTAHQHSHGHNHGSGSSTRILIFSLVFTTAFAGVEVVGGLWANSLALIADAGHMITDSLSLGIGAFAAWLSQRRASKRHTYGFARAETIGALVNTLFMLGVVAWIVIAALDRLTAPVEVGGVLVMVVAFIGLLVNVVVAWMLLRGEKNMNVRAALLHVMGDLAGSVAALASGVVIYLTGWVLIDPLLSLFISVLIGFASITVLRDVLHVLMEGTPKSVDPTEVTRTLRLIDGVRDVHHLHIWSLSSSRHALSAEIEVEALEAWDVILPRLQQVLGDRFDLHHSTLQPQTQCSTVRAESAGNCHSSDS